MSIKKITKEELLEKFGDKALSDDELEKFSGGSFSSCMENAQADLDCCLTIASHESDPVAWRNMSNMCNETYNEKRAECFS